MPPMTPARPRPIVIAFAVIVILGAGGVALWRALTDPPVLVRAGGGTQVCLACFESSRPDAFTLRAERVSRSYRATRDASVEIRFGAGTVEVAGVPLATGCHVVSMATDTSVAFVDARGVVVRWPVPVDACGD